MMTVTGCASFKNSSNICMLNPYVVFYDVIFSRLAANTLGLAFTVVVSESPDTYGTILCLGGAEESPTVRTNNSLLNQSKPLQDVPNRSCSLEDRSAFG